MKTINNFQETGNRNIKKSTMKTFAVLTSLAMFGIFFQARAGNSAMPGATHDNFSSTMAIADLMPAANAAGLPVTFMEAVKEENLEVESWMTNENLFAPMAVFETEEPMQVEEWMINDENFMETTFADESDQVLEVEDWMLDNEHFTSLTISRETEKVLDVEAWMLSENTWGK